MVITSSAPIGAAALFTLYSNDSVFQTEAGVQDSPSYTRVTLPIDFKVQNGGTVYGTGFALFNPNATAISLKPSFFDGDGLMSTAGIITLQPMSQQAMFFDSVFPGLGTVQGSLAFQGLTGTNGVSAMVLRMNMSPFNMTSFTAVSGTAAGASYTNGTPRFTYMDVTATMTSVNKTIPGAPTLTVTSSGVSSPYAPYTYNYTQVISQSSGRMYKVKGDATTLTATLYVPPGWYTTRVMNWNAALVTQYTGVFETYTTDPFYFSTTTTQTVAFPNVPLRNVTGTINGWSALGLGTTAGMSFYGTALTNSHLQFVVYCNTSTTAGAGDGNTFIQAFPEGIYTAAVLQPAMMLPSSGFSGTQPTEVMSFQNLLPSGATFTVDSNNNPVTLNAPSGVASLWSNNSVQHTGPFTLSIHDNALPNLGYINPNAFDHLGAIPYPMNVYPGYIYYPRDTVWTQNPFGGQYSAKVAVGSSYKLTNTFTVYNASTTSVGVATYSPPDGLSTYIDGDHQYDFNPGTLAPLVQISGTVSGYFGGASSTVMARSDQIIGADGNVIPGLSFWTAVPVSAAGSYTLNLLPGYSYQIYYNTAAELVVQ